MSFEYFTFDNGRDKCRVDFDQFAEELEKVTGKTQKSELRKLFSLFDKDGSGTIDLAPKAGEPESEAASLFGFIKRIQDTENVSENKELSAWFREKGINEEEEAKIIESVTTFVENLANGVKVTYENDKLVKMEEEGKVTEYIYHNAEGEDPAFVEIRVNNGEETVLVSQINEDGSFNEEDFIEKSCKDENGHEVVIKNNEFGLITKTVIYSDDEVLSTTYKTDSIHIWNSFKDTLQMDAVQVYVKGKNSYTVYYDEKGNTLTYATEQDTPGKLIKKFGFKNRKQFNELNPALKDMENIPAGTPITVSGKLSANDDRIKKQGTTEQIKEYVAEANRKHQEQIREEYLGDITEEVYEALQNTEGFELDEDSFGMYQLFNGIEEDKQKAFLHIIKDSIAKGKNITPREVGYDILRSEYFPNISTKHGRI